MIKDSTLAFIVNQKNVFSITFSEAEFEKETSLSSLNICYNHNFKSTLLGENLIKSIEFDHCRISNTQLKYLNNIRELSIDLPLDKKIVRSEEKFNVKHFHFNIDIKFDTNTNTDKDQPLEIILNPNTTHISVYMIYNKNISKLCSLVSISKNILYFDCGHLDGETRFNYCSAMFNTKDIATLVKNKNLYCLDASFLNIDYKSLLNTHLKRNKSIMYVNTNNKKTSQETNEDIYVVPNKVRNNYQKNIIRYGWKADNALASGDFLWKEIKKNKTLRNLVKKRSKRMFFS